MRLTTGNIGTGYIGPPRTFAGGVIRVDQGRGKDMSSRNDDRARKVSPATLRRAAPMSPKATEAHRVCPASDKEVIQCARRLSQPVPALRKYFSPTTIALAMLTQTAASLRSLIETGVMSRRRGKRECLEFTAYVLAAGGKREVKPSRSPSRRRLNSPNAVDESD
jgi:hypothetical protein